MPKYRVLLTEVITNSAMIEMEADSEEQIYERIDEQEDYDPEVFEPSTLEVFIGHIQEISS